MSGIQVMFLVIALAALYVLPAAIAWQHKHRHAKAIIALDLLAGWTVIGWLVALVWALVQVDRPTRAQLNRDHDQQQDARRTPGLTPRGRPS